MANKEQILHTEIQDVPAFSRDIGGRARISFMTTLFDGKNLGLFNTNYWEDVGTGTVTFNNNKSDLAVTSGQFALKQTTRAFPYFSGKVQLIEITTINFHTQANVTKEIGYISSSTTSPYDSVLDGFRLIDNGVTKVFEMWNNGVRIYFVNLEDMSGYMDIEGYNFTNFSVFAFDFLWLGGAGIRIFLKTQKGFCLLHQYDHAGLTTDTFMKSPSQHLRAALRSSTGVGSFTYVCGQVASEGGSGETGEVLSLYNSTTVATNSISTVYVLKGIKGNTSYLDAVIQLRSLGVVTSSNDAGTIYLLKNPTLSAGLTYASVGKIREATGSGETVTSMGTAIAVVPSYRAGENNIEDNNLSYLTHSIGGVADEYILAYQPATTNQSNKGILSYKVY